MEILKYGDLSYEVDHAVKGPDYVHGYDVSGDLVVSFEGVADFEDIQYTGSYLEPDACLSEIRNRVMNVNGKLVRGDGTPVVDEDLDNALAGKMSNKSASIYSDHGVPETRLNKWLDETILPSMQNNEFKNIQFKCEAICTWPLVGTIHKTNNNNAVVDVVEHLTGVHYTKVKNSVWKDAVPTDLIYTSGNIYSNTFTTKDKDTSRFYIVEVTNSYDMSRDTIAVNVYTTGEGTLRYTRAFYFDAGGAGSGTDGYKLAVTKSASGAVKFDIESGNATLFRITGYA